MKTKSARHFIKLNPKDIMGTKEPITNHYPSDPDIDWEALTNSDDQLKHW